MVAQEIVAGDHRIHTADQRSETPRPGGAVTASRSIGIAEKNRIVKVKKQQAHDSPQQPELPGRQQLPL
jgi:hypothetical protein